jgi:serine/threonine-protein kinase
MTAGADGGGDESAKRKQGRKDADETTSFSGSVSDVKESQQSGPPEERESSEESGLTEAVSTNAYRFLTPVGQGGMGTIYRAYDITLQREVAIKVLRLEHRGSSLAVQRFVNESLIKAGLQHPGINPVYAIGRLADGRPFQVMKLLHGKTLDQLLLAERAEGRERDLLDVMAQVAQAMAYVHSRGIVHLDLKPSNIMVGDFGRVSVIDWGLACRLGTTYFDREALWGRGDRLGTEQEDGGPAEGGRRVSGTPAYMSPEQARGEPVDARSDVFSLGAILCEILTGSRIYRGRSHLQLLRHAMVGATDGAMVGLVESEAEKWLQGLVKRCLASDPQARPADARELSRELADLQDSNLRLAESDMVRFFELSPDLFCIAGFDGCFRRVNANFPRLLKYSQQELLSQPFLNFVIPEDRDRTVRELGRLQEGGRVERFRNRYRTGDDRVRLLEWTAKSVPAEQLIFAVARDVTPQLEIDPSYHV